MKIIILKMLIWLKIVQHIKLNKKYCEVADDSNTEQSLYRKAQKSSFPILQSAQEILQIVPIKNFTLCTHFQVFLSHH